MTQNVVVEWAPFAVKSDVDDVELIAASEALQNDFLSRQRGFIRRDLLKGQNGQWVDVAYDRIDAETVQHERSSHSN